MEVIAMGKKAVVLSGGGARGAYQVGVWKALRKLHYQYNIVTGTSVGALNGMMMVQRDYFKCLKIWEKMDFDQLFTEKFPKKINGLFGKAEIYKKYASQFFKHGGMNTSRFEQLVYKVYRPFRFFHSSIDFGIVTYNFTALKSVEIRKQEMNDTTAPLYVIASASCFPAFPMKQIDGEKYIDGGYTDNIPINLAISLGATEIIAVDLNAIGRKRKVNTEHVKITTIEPRNQIASFLVFEKELSQKAIRYGYNDTMKTFHKLEGNIFTFYPRELEKQYSKIETLLHEFLVEKLFTYKQKIEEQRLRLSIFHKLLEDQSVKQRQQVFLEIIELIGKNLKLDDSKVYRMRVFSKEIKKSLEKMNDIKLDHVVEIIKKRKVKSLLGTPIILKFLYDKLEQNISEKEYYRYALLFPKELIAASYLHVIYKIDA